MKSRIFLLLALTPFILLTSCSGDQSPSDADTTATLSGTIEDSLRGTVTLWEVMAVGKDVQVDIDSAATPEFSLTADVPAAGMYRLRYGRNSITTFLHPGDDLQLEASAEDLAGTALFSGEGSAVNNYLLDSDRALKAYSEKLEEKNPYKLDEEAFVARVNEQKDKRLEVYDARFGDGNASAIFESFALAQIEGEHASLMTNYPAYHGYYTGLKDFEISDEFQKELDKIDMSNGDAIIAPDYRSFLSSRAQQGMNDMVDADTTLAEDWPAAFRKYYSVLKNDDAYSPEAKEYLLASHLNNYISYFGVDGVDEIKSDFDQTYSESVYAEGLQTEYDNWAKLAKGQPAPGFKYKSIDGAEVSLSDFKGKVVYVDVWATWCGPCKREIPASKELKQTLKGEDVVFLYVSVDDSQESWEDYLENDPEFKGVHLITGSGWKSDITDDYMISGIPRYMLIDQASNIVSASAPRPSSGEEIENLIRETIATGVSTSGD